MSDQVTLPVNQPYSRITVEGAEIHAAPLCSFVTGEHQVCKEGSCPSTVECKISNDTLPVEIIFPASGERRPLQRIGLGFEPIKETDPARNALLWRYSDEVPSENEPRENTASWHEKTVGMLRGSPKCHRTLWHKCAAEMVGTFMIVLFGCGSVCAAVLTGAQQGLWQVAVVWGFGVALSIYATASISGAHLNPAVSLAFALVRPSEFPLLHLLPYWAAQLVGASLAGCVNLLVFNTALASFETHHNIIRGAPASVLTAACFGEYFPNPAFQYSPTQNGASGASPTPNSALAWGADFISPFGACMVEAWGTMILAFVIFALTDARNTTLVRKEQVPFLIGFTVAVLISLYAPLTQAGWNPARDFGPRLVAAFAGWGEVAIPGPNGGFWVYIVGPMLGAPLGAAAYEFLLARGLNIAGEEELGACTSDQCVDGAGAV